MKTPRGFTAIELTIVIVLIGLLSALAAPRLLDRQALAERASADELRALLRSARQIAVAQEREVCVMVIGATVQAVHVSAGACDLATPVAGPGGQGALRLGAPTGMAYTGNPLVRFNARGQLNPAVDRVMGIGTRLWRVDRFTGAVS
jgi:prepilin-type N-terminal cleavage/methylation domain-containing protein